MENKKNKIGKPTIFLKKNRKGTILLENIIFIVLNIMFIVILILFVYKHGSGAVVLEQSYAKNIALLIDSAKPVSELKLNMEEGFDLAEKNSVSRNEIVKIEDNIVIVKLTKDSEYQYSFFNNVDATTYADEIPNKNYIIKINAYR